MLSLLQLRERNAKEEWNFLVLSTTTKKQPRLINGEGARKLHHLVATAINYISPRSNTDAMESGAPRSQLLNYLLLESRSPLARRPAFAPKKHFYLTSSFLRSRIIHHTRVITTRLPRCSRYSISFSFPLEENDQRFTEEKKNINRWYVNPKWTIPGSATPYPLPGTLTDSRGTWNRATVRKRHACIRRSIFLSLDFSRLTRLQPDTSGSSTP